MSKKIGFVDYNPDNFHANTYLRLIRQDLKDLGFEVAGCYGLKEKEGEKWAAANGVSYYRNARELADNVDFFAILAPSNPELHLDLCRKVFPFGRPTFVDKTFAPDLATAKKIFSLADKYRAKIETSSALRYTPVQRHVESVGGSNRVKHMVAYAPGGSFHEYGIHPVEMVVSCMGADAVSLMRRGTGNAIQLLVNYPEGRTATINLYCKTNTSYAATVTTSKATEFVTVDNDLFKDACAGFLRLFSTGKPGVPRKESLMIRRILDKSTDPKALKGFVGLQV